MASGRVTRRLAAVAIVLVAGGACSDDGGSGSAVPSTTVPSDATVATTSTPPTTTSGVAGPITVRGKVSALFASARVLELDPPVDGYSSVALTGATEFRRADGSPATFADVDEGATVVVTGEPGSAGTVIAHLVVIDF